MYEKEIEALESYRNVLDKGDEAALEAAIALMKSAQPKDEAAEHEHCEAVAWDRDDGYMHLRESDHPGECLTQLLMRERASARAESAAEVERLRGAVTAAISALSVYEGQGGTGEIVANDLRASLEAAKDDRAAMYAQTERNIAELRAEIARLRGEIVAEQRVSIACREVTAKARARLARELCLEQSKRCEVEVELAAVRARLIEQIEALKDDKAAMYAQAEHNVAELRELRARLSGLEK